MNNHGAKVARSKFSQWLDKPVTPLFAVVFIGMAITVFIILQRILQMVLVILLTHVPEPGTMVMLSTQKQPPEVTNYVFEVDYDQPLADAIAVGKFDRVNKDIVADHFPSTQTGKKVVRGQLYYFNPDPGVDSEIVEYEMERNGMRPATLPELLAFGMTYPELQRQFSIVAVGSRPTFFPFRFPALAEHKGGRVAELPDDPRLNYWREDCRFLAVPK